MEKKHAAMIIIVISIFIVPLLLQSNNQGSSVGTDDAAMAQIEQTGYTAWFEPIWKFSANETENLFPAVQAAIGFIIIGSVILYYHKKDRST